MIATELLILNFEATRRRSIKVWKAISEEDLFWRPDFEAMSCFEMIRHVLESENIYHHIILKRGAACNYQCPLTGNPYTNLDDELKNAQPYREKFLKMVHTFTAKELNEVYIARKEKNQHCKLGDYLLHIAYHEAVHTGKLLDYLRTLNSPKANVWD